MYTKFEPWQSFSFIKKVSFKTYIKSKYGRSEESQKPNKIIPDIRNKISFYVLKWIIMVKFIIKCNK